MRNIDKFLGIERPDDVARLREDSNLRHCTDKEVEILYERFSDEIYCAGWMILSDELVKEFSEWLHAEAYEPEPQSQIHYSPEAVRVLKDNLALSPSTRRKAGMG